MSTEQLEALRSEAQDIDAASMPQAEGAAPEGAAPSDVQQQPGNREAIAFLFFGFRELACAILKVNTPRATLADPQVEAVAGVLAPVADKYGLQLHSAIGGVEAQAVMIAGPILWTAWRELDAELRSRRARPVKPEGEGDIAPAETPAPTAAPEEVPAGEAQEFRE